MQTPSVSYVPAHLLPRLALLRPYTVVILRKGPAHDGPDTQRRIQAEHLPYLLNLIDQGIVAISVPIMVDADVRAIAVFNSNDLAEVRAVLDRDPCVSHGVFIAEVLPGMGEPGAKLATG